MYLLFRTTRDIDAGMEMLVYYGNEYAEKLNIDTKVEKLLQTKYVKTGEFLLLTRPLLRYPFFSLENLLIQPKVYEVEIHQYLNRAFDYCILEKTVKLLYQLLL